MTQTPQRSTGRDDDEIVAPPGSRSREWSREHVRARMVLANERLNAKSGRNLLGAIGIGVLLGGLLAISLLFEKRWFIPFGTLLIAIVVTELATAMRQARRRVPRIPSVVLALIAAPLAYYVPPGSHWTVILLGLLGIIIWRVIEVLLAHERPSKAQLAADASATAFVHFYVTFLGSFTIMLLSQPLGEYWVLTFAAIVICVDTGAYVTGMRFGRTKMAPTISPSKTWEGLAGGAILGIITAVAACELLLGLPWWFGIFMGISITIAAVVGDLTESMIKRDLGVKDMSNWLPGHGGFFDRFDSLLPAGAVAFALYFWSTPLMEFAQRLS